ncbi:ferrous iron transporter B [Candidatus Palauibacter polyketidifaciens]|uniref:ferrous iron transporter B n=1 Tax=Candidatus Palauibacter polyketidifaciens TaxID=3056740 RepID=UPI00239D4A3E|nr:ferrous iron transporter B [Candidatus Palauibacter polyketidifaciens]MDE2719744.1 ferrous iron transporter B [Candidatus Palauibacter polyketidifaciens]
MPPVATPARADHGAGTDAPASGPPVVALIGPPNSGKTTLFNRLTGLRQRVANYPGVTVEKHVGRARFASGLDLDIVDLPGVSGFSARSPDERVTRDVLEGRIEGLRAPEAIVLIVDAVRLETQLMLVGPVLERERPTLLVLNMADELEAGDGTLDDEALAAAFGVEAVRTDARTGRGVEAVAHFLDRVAMRAATPATGAKPGSGSGARTGRAGLPTMDALSRRREVVQDALASAKYRSAGPPKLTQRLDALFLHRIAGPAVFLVLAALVFQAIFTWATPIMDGVEIGIASSGEWLAARLPASWFRDLLIDGVWAGVGSVLVFLPQILILFLFLGILEDSGYMARAAVIADRTMLRVGLQGRAFLPLLSAYACAVPAILSARTVEDERDRMATMFIAPFMTCSARLPVYALLIAAFIPEQPLLGPFFGTRAATMLGLYALGLVAAIGTAFLLRRTFLRGKPAGFVMELPPYRIPALRTVALRLLDRSKIFLRRVGKIILAVTVVLWVLAQFPRVDGAPPPVDESALGQMGQVIEPAIEPLGFDWRIGVGLVSSLAAREVIVGTLGTIYGIEDGDETSLELRAALQRDLDFGGAIALLVFFVFALQCMSTVAMMRRETAGWKWPLAQFGYMLALAYAGALAANQLL